MQVPLSSVSEVFSFKLRKDFQSEAFQLTIREAIECDISLHIYIYAYVCACCDRSSRANPTRFAPRLTTFSKVWNPEN